MRAVVEKLGSLALLTMVAVLVGEGVAGAQTPPPRGPVWTCDSFQTQDEAQLFLDYFPGDWSSGLDEDGDGVACADLPARPPLPNQQVSTPDGLDIRNEGTSTGSNSSTSVGSPSTTTSSTVAPTTTTTAATGDALPRTGTDHLRPILAAAGALFILGSAFLLAGGPPRMRARRG